jgi:hypothetical protein
MPNYRITVKTGNQDSAGTDANVYITLHGTKNSTSEQQIGPADKYFERGNQDVFTLPFNDLGDLTKVRIRHDNANDHPGWYLVEIRIVDEDPDKEYNFPCNKWLATDEDDGLIDRTLKVA